LLEVAEGSGVDVFMGVSVKMGVGVSLGMDSAIWVNVPNTPAWAVSAMEVLMKVSCVGVAVSVAGAGLQALVTSRISAIDRNRTILFVFMRFSLKGKLFPRRHTMT
jgi:hypothetical protein